MELLFTMGIISLMVLFVIIPLLKVLYQRIRHGSIMIPRSNILITATMLPIAYFLSVLFAHDKNTALLGFSFNTDSFSVIFLGFLALLLTVFIGTRKEIADTLEKSLMKGLWVMTLFFGFQILMQMIGINPLSWMSLGQPIGSWMDIALIVSILILFLLDTKKRDDSEIEELLPYKKQVVISLLLLSLGFFIHITSIFVLLFLITLFKLSWIRKTARHEKKKMTHAMIVLPVLVIIISSFFMIDDFFLKGKVVHTVQGWTKISFITVKPNWQGTLTVAKGVIMNGNMTSKLFGSGVGSFEREWRMYKPLAVNTTEFWNTSFTYAIGFVPTSIITGGAAVFAAWALFLLSIFTAVFKGRASSLGIATLFIWIFSLINPLSPITLLIAYILTGLFVVESARLRNIRMINYKLRGKNVNKFITFGIIPIVIISSSILLLIFAHRILVHTYIMRASSSLIQGDRDKTEDLLNQVRSFADVSLVEQEYTKVAGAQLSSMLSQNKKKSGSVTTEVMQQALSNLIFHAKGAIAKDPQNPTHYISLGTISEQLISLDVDGAAETALGAYEKATFLDPQNPALPLFIARVHTASGDIDKAGIFLEKSLQLKPNFEPALYQYGLLRLSKKDTKAAVKIFGTLVQINENHANALYYLSLALSSEHRIKEALAVMQRVVLLNPENKDVEKLVKDLERVITAQKNK